MERNPIAMKTVPQNNEQLRQEVSARYAQTALQVLGTASESMVSCCASSCCTTDASKSNLITSDLYTQMELGAIPVAAALASLGCGNPTALAELKPGKKVLDLGSGGGI